MCGVRRCVLPYASPLYVKAGETVYFFLENTKFFFRQTAHEHLLGERRVAGIFVPVLYFGHSLVEIILRYAERAAKLEGVDAAFRLVGNNHYVVGVLIIDK